MCAIIEVQTLLYKYCYMQYNVNFSHVKNFVLKILDALFELKCKDKYERKMLNRLKLTKFFKRKIYINLYNLYKVLFFFGGGRSANGKRMKQNKSCLKMSHYKISPIRGKKT